MDLPVNPMRRILKSGFVSLLSSLYRATSGLRRNLQRIRSHAALSSSLAVPLDASVVVRWLVGGPYAGECQTLLARCGDLDVRLLAPTCLYS